MQLSRAGSVHRIRNSRHPEFGLNWSFLFKKLISSIFGGSEFLRIAWNLLPTYVKIPGASFELIEIFFWNPELPGIAAIGPWSTTFCRKKAFYMCFPYISTMRKTNIILKFSLDPLEFRNSGVHGIAGIETWSIKFCRKKAYYICFPYTSTTRNTNPIFKFSLNPLEFRNPWNC